MLRKSLFSILGILIVASLCIAAARMNHTEGHVSNRPQMIKSLRLANPFATEDQLRGSATTVQPVVITGATFKGQSVLTDQFMGDDSWFNDLKVRVKNVSNRTVAGVTLKYEFDDAVSSEGTTQALNIGIGESRFRVSPKGFVLPGFSLEAGEEVLISFDGWRPNHYEEYAKHFTHAGLSAANFSRLSIYIREVQFKNGDIWVNGQSLTPDPDHPGKYKRWP